MSLGFYDLKIEGAGFESTTTVTIDGEDCPLVGNITVGMIYCTVPPHVRYSSLFY